MAEEKKKNKKKKIEEVVEVQEEVVVEVEESLTNVEEVADTNISNIVEELVNETLVEEVKEIVEEETKKEVEKQIATCFTTEEKLFIVKLIADGYRPFDIVKKARFKFKLSEEKLRRLSLNVRTVEQLINAMEM